MSTTLTTIDYTEEQVNAVIKFVKDNSERLTKQFGAKHIAVEYRDVRGGVVVDSGFDELKLVGRLNRAKYGPLMVRTIEDFIGEGERFSMFSEGIKNVEAIA